MKKRFLWMLAPALIFGALSCKKKDEGGQAAQPNQPAEVANVAESNDDPIAPADPASASKRVEVLGFARHLPQDAEYMISIHGGSDAAKRIAGSKVWQTFAAMSGIQPAGDPDAGEEMIEAIMTEGPGAMLAHEFTLAMGKGTSDQINHLVTINNRLNYFQMSGLVQMLSNSMEGDGDNLLMRGMNQFSEEFIIEVLNDPKSGIALLEKTQMPPMYVAFKTTEENREMVNQQVTAGLQFFGMLEGMSKPVTIERGESSFKGFHIMGEQIAKEMEESKEEMEEVMPAETASRLIKAISDKNLYVVNGIYEDYVVVFMGSSPEDLVFAEEASGSLAGSNALAFCDPYASKDLLAVLYGQDAGLKSVMKQAKGGLADMSAGIRDGLANSDNFGDTRNLDALLRMVEESEAAVHALGKVHGGGTVAFFDEGLKIESYGGFDSGMIDFNTPNRLASLGDDPDVLFFANMSSNADYDTKMRDYIETIFETAYAGAMKMSELPIKGADMEEFKGMLQMFDTKFRADLLTFWEGFSNGYDGSLGQERAMVIDLQGGMPAFPGVPQKMVDSAKFPRATWIAPVNDRTKLAGAWKKMNTSMTSIAASISEMAGTDFPMQKPLSSDKDGSTTWFFPLPFFNDDFLPSVTVNDKWFTASSSKLQAVDLIAKANEGGKTSQGFYMKADFTQLHAYAQDMVGLVLKNNEDLDISENDLKQVEQVLDGFSEINSMTMHIRRDKGQLRSSFHFKVAE